MKIKQEPVEHPTGNVRGVIPIPAGAAPDNKLIIQVKELTNAGEYERRLPGGDDRIRKIQKSPLYSTNAVKNALFQDPTTLQNFNTFMSSLPMLKGLVERQQQEENARKMARKEKENSELKKKAKKEKKEREGKEKKK